MVGEGNELFQRVLDLMKRGVRLVVYMGLAKRWLASSLVCRAQFCTVRSLTRYSIQNEIAQVSLWFHAATRVLVLGWVVRALKGLVEQYHYRIW